MPPNKPKSSSKPYSSATEANEVGQLIREQIGFSRVKILERLKSGYQVEYNGEKIDIASGETSHWSSERESGGGCGMTLELRQTLVLIPESGIFQDDEAPDEFKEVIMFHELREKEYSEAGFGDAHERAVRDETLYILQHFDGKTQKEYLIWAKGIRHSAQQEMLSKMAENEPGIFFDSIESHLQTGDIEAYAKIAAKKNPLSAFGQIESYKSMPWAKEITLIAAEHDGDAVYRFWETLKTLPWAKEIQKRAADKSQPKIILKHYDFFNSVPGACQKAAQALAKTDPLALAEFLDNFVSEPWAEGILATAALALAEKSPSRSLELAVALKDPTMTLEVIEKVATANPVAALASSKKYKDAPCHDSVLEKAVRALLDPTPAEVLRYMDHFVDLSWAAEVIEKASEKLPERALKYLYKYKGQPWADEIMAKAEKIIEEKRLENEKQRLAEEEKNKSEIDLPIQDADEKGIPKPKPLASAIESFKNFAELKSILEKHRDPTGFNYDALRPLHVVSGFHLYQEKVWAVEALEIAAREWADRKECPSLFEYAGIFAKFSWAKEVLEKAVVIDPLGAVIHFGKYSKMPWAGEMLEKAARICADSRSSSLFAHAKKLIQFPWAKEVLEMAAATKPEPVFKYFEKYREMPWAGEVLEVAARIYANSLSNPLFAHSKILIQYPWAKEVLEKAVIMNPEDAIKYFNDYCEMPWSEEIIAKATTRLKELKKEGK